MYNSQHIPEPCVGITTGGDIKAILDATDVKAVVAAMFSCRYCDRVQASACGALYQLMTDNAENTTNAWTAGALKAMVDAMRGYAGNVSLQGRACQVLYAMNKNNPEKGERAGEMGAIVVVAGALRAHARSEVVAEWGGGVRQCVTWLAAI
jgi:hypothetical protein